MKSLIFLSQRLRARAKTFAWPTPGFLAISVLCFFPGMVLAQEQPWKTFNTNDGLAHNDVRALAVDGDFIWFGTHGGGLSRYQKSIETWTTFNVTNSGIVSNFVSAVAVDGDQVLLGTDKGISRYRKSVSTWETLATFNCITAIGVDVDELWFATAGSGVHRYEKTNGRWTVLDSTNSQLPSNTVTSIAMDGDIIWFGTAAGVTRYRQFTGEMLNFRAALSGLASNAVNAVAIDGAAVWFGHAPGRLYGGAFSINFLNLFSPTNCPPQSLLSELNVKFPGGPNASMSRLNTATNQWQNFEVCVSGPDTLRREKKCYPVQSVATRENEVWFGTVSRGVYRYNKTSGAMVNFNTTNSGLAGDLVWAIAFDETYVWMGTFNQGVSRYKHPTNLWTTYRKSDGLVDEYVEDLDVLGDEAWFGTHRGVSRLQISTEQWTSFSFGSGAPLLNYAIGVDTNEVWAGPILSRYQKSTNTWSEVDTIDSKLGVSLVYSIFVDKTEVWFGAEHGKISRYHKPTGAWTLFDSTVTQFRATIRALDFSDDAVWFGGLGGGAGHFNLATNTWTKFDSSNSGLAHDNVTSVAVDGEYAWFGTFGGGISRYHTPTNRWVTFNRANTGIPFLDTIWAVAVDDDYVWFGTHSNGAYRYSKSSGQWENFNTLNSPLVSRRVYDIEIEDGCVWLSTYDPFGTKLGSVHRYCDVSPPSVLHAPVSGEQPSAQNVLILASIDDNVSVKSATINYRLLGTTIYKSAPLQRLSGDTWFGQIPGSDVVPGVMEYYLSASDGRNAATHPYSSAPNAPHRFTVYDAVPPIVSPFIDSPNPNNVVFDSTLIDVRIRLDGTGSFPTLQKIELMQYSDLAATIAIDSVTAALLNAQQDTTGSVIAITGKMNVGDLRDSTKAILIRVTATDEGHDREGNRFRITVSSNPLFTPTPSAALAQITAPDSAAIVKSPVTIKGTASHPNIKQFILSYLDSLGNSGIIASGTDVRENAILGIWDTTPLSEGSYEIRLRVESSDGSFKTASVPVVVDNTPPQAAIENLMDNDTLGGKIVIKGIASDKHFKTYDVKFGEGVNPANYQTLRESTVPVAVSDTLAEWNTAGLNGLYSLRLRVLDKAGLEAFVTKVLTLDNTAVQIRISSPQNGAVVAGTVEVRGAVLDANLQEYLVEYAANSTPGHWIKIHSAAEQVSNGLLAVWDTQNLNGRFMLRLTARDKTNSIVVDTVNVIVDNDDPVAELNWPRDGYQVGGIVEIRGTATDANFDKYTLELAEDSAPEIFTPLTNTIFREPVVKGILHTWPVGNRAGEYTLQLTVHDKVGHKKAARAVVRIVEPISAQRGGCVRSEDGKVELCLPPNALRENTTILINPLSSEESDPKLLGAIYEISPTAIKLLKPGTLRMSYAPENISMESEQQKLAIAIRTETNSAWRVLGGNVDPSRHAVTTAVNELGWFALALGEGLAVENLIPGIVIQPRVFSPIKGVFDYKTSVVLTLENPTNVTVKVYHPNGRLKAVLRDNAALNRGASTIEWNGRDADGNVVPSGLYILLIEMEGKTVKKTVMVLNN